MNTNQSLTQFFEEQLQQAKVLFERALDCKHTEFDDLYPYMNEQPQFFWYKRYVAWQELLTVVRLASDLKIDWQPVFSPTQMSLLTKRSLKRKFLISGMKMRNKKKWKRKLVQMTS